MEIKSFMYIDIFYINLIMYFSKQISYDVEIYLKHGCKKPSVHRFVSLDVTFIVIGYANIP